MLASLLNEEANVMRLNGCGERKNDVSAQYSELGEQFQGEVRS